MQISRPTAYALVALAMGITLSLRARSHDHATELETYEDIYYLPPAHWLPVFSLGHHAALTDLLWIRGLIYMGDEYRHRGAMNYVFDYTEAMLSLDPDFEALYHWIATAGLYQPEAIGRDEILRTLDLLERGVARMPESGQLQWDLGATYAFEAGPYARDDAERDAWRLAGAEHLMAAARLGAAPPWMVLTNTRLLMRVGENERAVEHLEEMYSAVDDPAVREEISIRIASLRNETYSSAFVEESEALEERRLRTYPFMPPSMYFLMGDPADIDSSLRDGFAAHVFDDELSLVDE